MRYVEHAADCRDGAWFADGYKDGVQGRCTISVADLDSHDVFEANLRAFDTGQTDVGSLCGGTDGYDGVLVARAGGA